MILFISFSSTATLHLRTLLFLTLSKMITALAMLQRIVVKTTGCSGTDTYWLLAASDSVIFNHTVPLHRSQLTGGMI